MNVIPFHLTPTLYYVHISTNITTWRKHETLGRRSQQHISNHTPNMVPYLEAYITLPKESFESASIGQIYINIWKI